MKIIDEGLFSGKVCLICGAWKSLGDYYQKRENEVQSYCKPCYKVRCVERHRAKFQALPPEAQAEVLRLARERVRANAPEQSRREREWRKANPVAARARDKFNRERYRDQILVTNQQRHARKKSAHGSFTLPEWEGVKQAQDYTCLMCGQREPEIRLTVDHVIALARGGSNTIDNIAGLCRSCNASKGAKPIDYRGRRALTPKEGG